MNTISTLDALKQQLNITDTTDTARLRQALEFATATIERLTGRRFTPFQETRTQSIQPTDRTMLFLNGDLLSISTITDDTGTAIDLTQIMFLPDDDAPIRMLQMLNGNTFYYSKTYENAISVTGVWGWHDSPSQMWRNSGDSVGNNPLDASATMLTVTDSSLADSAGVSPRFQVGQLLRIDDEYVRVIGVSLSEIEVIRGVNGSIATSHIASTPIYSYQPPADVNGLCLRLATWHYREPDQRGSGDIPPALKHAIDRLRWVRV